MRDEARSEQFDIPGSRDKCIRDERGGKKKQNSAQIEEKEIERVCVAS